MCFFIKSRLWSQLHEVARDFNGEIINPERVGEGREITADMERRRAACQKNTPVDSDLRRLSQNQTDLWHFEVATNAKTFMLVQKEEV